MFRAKRRNNLKRTVGLAVLRKNNNSRVKRDEGIDVIVILLLNVNARTMASTHTHKYTRKTIRKQNLNSVFFSNHIKIL